MLCLQQHELLWFLIFNCVQHDVGYFGCSIGCGALFTGLKGLHSNVKTVITYVMAQFTIAAKAGVNSVPPIVAPQAAQIAVAKEKEINSTSIMIHAQLDSM